MALIRVLEVLNITHKTIKYIKEGNYVKVDTKVCSVCGKEHNEIFNLQELDVCDTCINAIGEGLTEDVVRGVAYESVDVDLAREYLKKYKLKYYIDNLEVINGTVRVRVEEEVALKEGDIRKLDIDGVESFYKVTNVEGEQVYEVTQLK